MTVRDEYSPEIPFLNRGLNGMRIPFVNSWKIDLFVDLCSLTFMQLNTPGHGSTVHASAKLCFPLGMPTCDESYLIWLVVWNMKFIFHNYWEFHHPNWRTHSIIFQRSRVQPPTSYVCCPLSKHQVLGWPVLFGREGAAGACFSMGNQSQ